MYFVFVSVNGSVKLKPIKHPINVFKISHVATHKCEKQTHLSKVHNVRTLRSV